MATLCAAGETLFRQVNRHWPIRDHASDGWLGTGGDHLPNAEGIVRATDIDSSFGGKPGYNTTEEAWKLANQLRLAMIAGDKRVAYIIAWNPAKGRDLICSMNPAYQPLGGWRDYTGDSHVNHIHVSYTPAGDHNGRTFDLPIFEQEEVVTKEEIREVVGELLGTKLFGDEADKALRDVTVRDTLRKVWKENH